MNNLNFFDFSLFLIVSFIVMKISFIILKKYQLVDNDNSLKLNLGKPIITSLGISFLFILFFNISYLLFTKDFGEILPNRFYIFFISIFVLTLLSFKDDIKDIDPKIRLIVQLIFVYFSLTNLELQNLNLPLKLIIFLTLVVWVYLINITNFIDGSDGHCGTHVLFLMIGILYVSYNENIYYFSTLLAFILVPILLIFLIFFNRPTAISFMGDTGSIFLGYIVGYVILERIFMQKDFFIISLFLYPILDCSINLIKKTINGYYPWARLGDYFFLIPIKNGHNHKKVFFVSIVYNITNLFFYIMQNNYSKLFFVCNLVISLILIFYYKSHKNEK